MKAFDDTAGSTTNPVTVALVLTSGSLPGSDRPAAALHLGDRGCVGRFAVDHVAQRPFSVQHVDRRIRADVDVEPWFSQSGPYLAAVNAALAYWIGTSANGEPVVSCYSPGGVTTLPPLPGTDTPAAVSAGADGTLWVIGAAGTMYSYAAAASTWTAMPAPPGQLLSLSVGGASTILGLTADAQIYAYANGAWTLQATTNIIDATWLGACLDGSYWLGTESGPTLVVAGGAAVPFQIPAGTQIYGMYAAGSRYGCYCVGSSPVRR